MRFFAPLLTVAALAQAATGLRILINDDDSWVSANIRELYKALKAAGHDVLMVAPVHNQSGKGGTIAFTNSKTLTKDGEFGYVKAGAPSFGQDPDDDHLWYYDGTPAACTLFALDYVAGKVWGQGKSPDLLVSGPNEGQNMGAHLYTFSGTIGATYRAIDRGIPGIAFSASEGEHRFFKDVKSSDDIATKHARIGAALVAQLVKAGKSPLLPPGYGISVNMPPLSGKCTDPKFVPTRMTGGSAAAEVANYDPNTGLVTGGSRSNFAGVSACINGDCNLVPETVAVDNCSIAVTVFTVDYDAPTGDGAKTADVRSSLAPLFSGSSSDGSGSGIANLADPLASSGNSHILVIRNSGSAIRRNGLFALGCALLGAVVFL